MMNHAKLYLPVFKRVLDREIALSSTGEVGDLRLAFAFDYERLGIDRLLAILIDMTRRGIWPGASVLDVGASTGLFSHAMADRGYLVTAVENDMASAVQSHYPVAPSEILRNYSGRGRLRVERTNFLEFVSRTSESWDVCILLSVVHQVYTGYALTEAGKADEKDISENLSALVSRSKRGLYYEFPANEEAGRRMGDFATPSWFLTHTAVVRCEQICSSASADGDMRPMYFMQTSP